MHASWIYILFNDDFQLSLIRDASTRKGYYMSAYKRDKNVKKNTLSLSGFEPLASRNCGGNHNVMI